jgi:hypothetical protein
LKRKIGMADRSTATAGKIAISVVLLALLTQPSYAQQFPETERQKAQEDRERAQEARKKADREATDEEYKAMTERTPKTSKKVDENYVVEAEKEGFALACYTLVLLSSCSGRQFEAA